MEPISGHHPQCEWEWGTCTCDQFLWDPSTARDDPGCVYVEPNYGSDQIHLNAGIGPLGPANAADLQDTAQAGLGQQPRVFPPASTTNPDGSVTIGDITYPPPTSGPSTPGWTPPSTIMTPGTSTTSGTELPYATQTQPGTSGGGPGSWTTPVPPFPSGALGPVSAPATPASTNTGMLVVGLVAVAAGVAGIAYLAHAYQTGAAAK
jgi:hypothetical protein